MNKDQFNALEILEQVEYINKGLESESVTKVCASIGIDRATVRKRFARNGYELVDNKYIPTESTPITTTKKTTVATKNTSTSKVTKKATEQTQENKQMKALESKIESLEKQIESINNILDTITTETTNNGTKNNIKIKKYKGVEGVRSYRVNAKVLEQWKVFCKAHSEHKVGDLLANAMVEYMNKYK